MPPKFSLQSVLDFRHSWVEKLEIELGNMMHSLQQGETLLETLEVNRYDLFQELTRQQTGDFDMFKITTIRKNINMLNEQIDQVKALLKELRAQVEAKRLEVIQAKQDEEVLVKLKDKEGERYRIEQIQIENRFQDDIYISTAFHNRKTGALN
jgi:flagellar FliJ protein